MNVLIDSSVWLEFFSGGKRSKDIEKYLRSPYKIVLPSIVTYEVYKKLKGSNSEHEAVLLTAQMERLSKSFVSIDQSLAVSAADVSLKYKIPMADALIYASAIDCSATLVSMDTHFKGLPDVKFIG